MTTPTAPNYLTVFRARAVARAYLWRAGEMDLIEAVDELQASAELDGLVEEIGVDAVQAVLCEVFGSARGSHG